MKMNYPEDNNNGKAQNAYRYAAALALAILVLTVIGFISTFTQSPVEVAIEEKEPTQEQINPFENIDLEAKAIYVFDTVRQEVLYAVNAQTQLPLASLTKLMTVIVANDILPDSTAIVIDSLSLALEGDSGFSIGEKWRIDDLIDIILISSSNDGANALAAVAGARLQSTYNQQSEVPIFIQAMNEKAAEFGLTQTYFINETGLDSGDIVSGGYGSARDIAYLFERILTTYPQLIEATRYETLTFTSLTDVEHTAKNTNNGLTAVPGLIGSKTGYTDLSGGNLVIAFDAGINYPVIVVVLGSTIEGRFSDIEKLTRASLVSISLTSK